MKNKLWIIPMVIALCVYSVALNNFFVYDDFIWLNRARTLSQNWRQMFSPDVIYFDPLIYLMFVADSFVAYLDPKWCHAVDLMIHAFNALLVYRFAKMLSGDDKAGLYGSILFASSFAIADAVLWPSSRVDLVSVMFSLGTLILFLKYLRTDNRRFLWLSCFLFILALGAKGTPVVMPLFLLWLLFMEEKPFRRFGSAAPFVLLVILYFALLKTTLHNIASPNTALHFNLGNVSLALCELFIPERHVATLNLAVTASMLAILVIALGFLKFSRVSLTRLRRTGIVILAGGLLPLLALGDFKPATNIKEMIFLLTSPSHRIYLATVGFVLIGGGVLRSLELLIKRYYPKAATLAVTLTLVSVVLFNAIEVRERDRIWEYAGMVTASGLYGLLDHRDKIREDGIIGLIGFPGSTGFLNPMIKVYFNLNEITTSKFLKVGPSAPIEMLKRAERSSFFVLGNDLRVYDLSNQFKKLLFLDKQAKLNPWIPEYVTEGDIISRDMNQTIVEVLKRDKM